MRNTRDRATAQFVVAFLRIPERNIHVRRIATFSVGTIVSAQQRATIRRSTSMIETMNHAARNYSDLFLCVKCQQIIRVSSGSKKPYDGLKKVNGMIGLFVGYVFHMPKKALL
jgi:hypothetical protein